MSWTLRLSTRNFLSFPGLAKLAWFKPAFDSKLENSNLLKGTSTVISDLCTNFLWWKRSTRINVFLGLKEYRVMSSVNSKMLRLTCQVWLWRTRASPSFFHNHKLWPTLCYNEVTELTFMFLGPLWLSQTQISADLFSVKKHLHFKMLEYFYMFTLNKSGCVCLGCCVQIGVFKYSIETASLPMDLTMAS